MQVGVRVEEEDMLTGARHHCCSAYLTFVSVMARPGPGRAAKPLPKIVPRTQHQREIFRAGQFHAWTSSHSARKAQSKLHLLGSMLASLRQMQQPCQWHQPDLQQELIVPCTLQTGSAFYPNWLPVDDAP